MQPRTVAAVSALIALAVWATWSLTAGAAEPQPAPPAEPPVSALPTPPSAASPAAATERSTAPTNAHEGLVVRVVDRDNAPVVGARIAVAGDRDTLSFPLTDDEGIATGARFPNRDVTLRASVDRQSGYASWRWTPALQREVTIRVQKARDVTVKVHDHAGNPVSDVLVGLAHQQRELHQIQEELKARSDENGQVDITVEGTQTYLLAHAEVVAVADSGSGETASHATPWNDDGVTTIDMLVDQDVAAVGVALTVRFATKTGAPATVAGKLYWSTVQKGGGGSTITWPAGDKAVAGTTATITGLADAAHLQLSLDEDGRLQGNSEVQIPSGARTYEVTLVQGAPAPRLEVPLVDRDGQPVTTGKYQTYVKQTYPHFAFEVSAEPDERGILSLVLASEDASTIEIASKRREDQLYHGAASGLKRPYNTTIGRPPSPEPVLAVREFPRVPVGTTFRVDPVIVPAAKTVVRGRVLDQNSQPVAGVRILLTTATLPEPVEFGRFATISDAEGRFAIRAIADLPANVMVCGRRVLGFCAPVRVGAAAEEVLLTLQPAGGLEVGLEPPRQLAKNERGIRVSLVIDPERLAPGWWALFRDDAWVGFRDTLGRWSATGYIRDEGPLVFDDLVPFTYDVRTFVGLVAALEVDGIVVVSGKTTRPPQLRGIALGDNLERSRVRVTDTDGNPVQGALVRFKLPAWEKTRPGGTNDKTDDNGEAWFVVPVGSVVDLEVVATGRAPARRGAATFPADIVMTRGTTFAVALEGHEPLRDTMRALTISVVEHGDAPPESPLVQFGNLSQVRHPLAAVDLESGRGELEHLPPARYRLWLSAQPKIGSPIRTTRFLVLGDFTVETGGPARVPVRHRLTAAELAALQRL